MEQLVEKVEVWAAMLEDKPGALANKLAGLAEAGADLEFVIARRTHDKPNKGIVFVTPIRGDREVEAATGLGFTVSKSLYTLRVQGDNRPGIGALLAEKVGKAGINLRGFSGSVIGTQFVVYLGFDSEANLKKAQKVLKTAS
jgi:hypothetical protein